MGLANIAAGLFGAMPMCHGSGGLTAHYKLGARTGAANLMIGGLLLALGLFLGGAALPVLLLIPLSVLGVLLAIVGIYHVFLVRDLKAKSQLAIAGTVAVVTIALGNLAFGFGAGILLHYMLRFFESQRARDLSRVISSHSLQADIPNADAAFALTDDQHPSSHRILAGARSKVAAAGREYASAVRNRSVVAISGFTDKGDES